MFISYIGEALSQAKMNLPYGMAFTKLFIDSGVRIPSAEPKIELRYTDYYKTGTLSRMGFQKIEGKWVRKQVSGTRLPTPPPPPSIPPSSNSSESSSSDESLPSVHRTPSPLPSSPHLPPSPVYTSFTTHAPSVPPESTPLQTPLFTTISAFTPSQTPIIGTPSPTPPASFPTAPPTIVTTPPTIVLTPPTTTTTPPPTSFTFSTEQMRQFASLVNDSLKPQFTYLDDQQSALKIWYQSQLSIQTSELRKEFQSQIEELRTENRELKTQISNLQPRFSDLYQEMREEISALRTQTSELRELQAAQPIAVSTIPPSSQLLPKKSVQEIARGLDSVREGRGFKVPERSSMPHRGA